MDRVEAVKAQVLAGTYIVSLSARGRESESVRARERKNEDRLTAGRGASIKDAAALSLSQCSPLLLLSSRALSTPSNASRKAIALQLCCFQDRKRERRSSQKVARCLRKKKTAAKSKKLNPDLLLLPPPPPPSSINHPPRTHTAIQPVIDQARPAVDDLLEKVRPHSERLLAAVDPHFHAATTAADGHLSALRPWQIAAASAAVAAVLSGAAGAAVRRLALVAALVAAAWAAAERHGLVEKSAQA